MSRIGKLPVEAPADVKISVDGDVISFVKGKDTRTLDTKGNVGISVDGQTLTFSTKSDAREDREVPRRTPTGDRDTDPYPCGDKHRRGSRPVNTQRRSTHRLRTRGPLHQPRRTDGESGEARHGRRQ